jgi:DNA-directed RNA polymerase specialized sigma24 family protein
MESADKKEFDKIREAENWLYNYKSTKTGIENLKENYKVLNGVGSEIELKLLDDRIKAMERKVEQIDRALNALSNIEREVINYKCIEGMYYYEFTCKVYTGERQCMRIKQRALKKIAIALGL